jgi:hypothetical protein
MRVRKIKVSYARSYAVLMLLVTAITTFGALAPDMPQAAFAGSSPVSAMSARSTVGEGLAFTSAASDTVNFGDAFNFTVTTSGSPVPTVARSGRLPAGVTFTRNGDGTGTISGTPAGSAAGTFPLELTARNKSGSITQAFTLTVTRAPAVRRTGSETVVVGSALTLAFAAAGYPAPSFTEAGPLPAGVSLTDNGDGTAAITGTPEVGSGGSYPVTVTATNDSGTASLDLTLKVDEAPVITTPDLTFAGAGIPFFFQVTATGFPAPKFSRSGSLPRGMTFSAATGILSGTPAAGDDGSSAVTITAKNSSGTVTQTLSIIFLGGGGFTF